MKRGSLSALAVASFFVFFGFACEHKQGDQPVVDLGGGGPPAPVPGGGINLPPPPEVWVVKEMTVRLNESGAVTEKDIFEYNDEGELSKIIHQLVNLTGSLQNVLAGEMHYSVGQAKLIMQGEEEELDISQRRFELDEKNRIKTLNLIGVGASESVILRAELDYENENHGRPETVRVFERGRIERSLPINPEIFIFAYNERNAISQIIDSSPPAGATPAREAVYVMYYDDKGYVRRQESLQSSARTVPPANFENTYDGSTGKIISIKRSLGEGVFRVHAFTYDENGNIESRCEDQGGDGIFEMCFEFSYIKLSKKPIFSDLILDPEWEAKEGLSQQIFGLSWLFKN